jgi:transcriptional regulator with XRE-family HTH domain
MHKGDAGQGRTREQAALASWLREAVSEAGMTQQALAARVYSVPHASAVSRILSGEVLPPRHVALDIARACGADQATAGRLWDAASAAAERREHRAAGGFPPEGLADHDALCLALDALVAQCGLSRRQLVERDESMVLTRSMADYVLRAQRNLTHRVLIAIITVCDVPPDARAEWQAEWRRLAPQKIAAGQRARLEGLRASQGGRLYRVRRWSW